MARAIWARRKWLAVLAFVGPLAAVISVLAFMPRFYDVSNAKKRERQANATASFLKVELEQTKQTLDLQEKRVGDYKKRNSGGLPDQAQMNMLTMERMYSELRMNRDAQGRLMERQEGAAGPGNGIDLPPVQDRAAARLALLRQELTELSTRYTDKYPDVVAKKSEIADLEQQVANAPK